VTVFDPETLAILEAAFNEAEKSSKAVADSLIKAQCGTPLLIWSSALRLTAKLIRSS
jgi:hypothetical protein